MILLTGATGYLGSQIALELSRRRMPLRVLVRDSMRLPFDPATAKCEVVVGDLTNLATLREALRGAEYVIHTAALVKTWVRNRQEFWRVNVHGLMDLLREAAEAGVRRVVYTSSFIALGPCADEKAGEGLVNRGPYSNEYEQSKAQALTWLRQERHHFPVVTLLPGVIYGPGPKTEGNLVGGMIDQYLAGKFPGLLGDGNQRWSFAYNADVVDAHISALEKGELGEEYILAGDNRTLNVFFRVLADLSGVSHSVLHLPFFAGKLVGALEVVRANFLSHTPQLTPGVVEIFKHDWVYSSKKAVAELGYRMTLLEDGIAKTLRASGHRVIWPSGH